jgi:hypothetical protein
MARKTETTVITAEGRDQGKHFVLTEMAASKAEAWAFRAFGAMTRSGVDIPEEIVTAGMVGLSAMGLKAFLASDWADVEPLLAEMMACVQFRPDPAGQPQIVRPLIEDDIEEPSTRAKLRDEVFKLHTGFSIAGSLLNAVGLAMRYLVAGANTETLTDESAQLSLQV